MTNEEINVKPKLQSVYSMGEWDFNRYDKHLKYVEEWCGIANATAVPELYMIQNYFSGLNTLYIIWRELIRLNNSREDIKSIDNLVDKLKAEKRRWENNEKLNAPFDAKLRLKMVDQLNDLFKLLAKQKQWIGLGIVLQRKLSTKQKIKAGIKGHLGDIDDLPEP